MTSNRSAAFFALALLAPALIYILIIVAYPLFDTIVLSFTNAALRPTYDFVGWANYLRIFTAGNFTEVIIRTFVWTFFSVAAKMVIGTMGATLLNAAIPGQTV
ncbi:MAG: sugar ABC transporter permease, partial [Alphaproteobacteria bacterium]